MPVRTGGVESNSVRAVFLLTRTCPRWSRNDCWCEDNPLQGSS